MKLENGRIKLHIKETETSKRESKEQLLPLTKKKPIGWVQPGKRPLSKRSEKMDAKKGHPVHPENFVEIDMPTNTDLIVTRHLVGMSWCKSCGKYHSAKKLPKYGPNIHAYVANLKFKLGLSLSKIQRHLSQQFNLKVSKDELNEMLNR